MDNSVANLPLFRPEFVTVANAVADSFYADLGESVGYLYKTGATATTVHALSGELQLSSTGFGLLSVPNALARGVFQALDEIGTELPKAPDGRPFNAHITVFRPEEIEQIGGSQKITEWGKHFHYTLGPVQTLEPEHGPASTVWIIEIQSKELERLRKSYGLAALPKRGTFPFHCTVAVRRHGVLQRGNTISKAAALTREKLREMASRVTKEPSKERIDAPRSQPSSQEFNKVSKLGNSEVHLHGVDEFNTQHDVALAVTDSGVNSVDGDQVFVSPVVAGTDVSHKVSSLLHFDAGVVAPSSLLPPKTGQVSSVEVGGLAPPSGSIFGVPQLGSKHAFQRIIALGSVFDLSGVVANGADFVEPLSRVVPFELCSGLGFFAQPTSKRASCKDLGPVGLGSDAAGIKREGIADVMPNFIGSGFGEKRDESRAGARAGHAAPDVVNTVNQTKLANDVHGPLVDALSFLGSLPSDSGAFLKKSIECIGVNDEGTYSGHISSSVGGTDHAPGVSSAQGHFNYAKQGAGLSRAKLDAVGQRVNKSPSQEQIKAHNWQMGHISFKGLPITIENPVGSVRSGVTKEGKPWRTEMRDHYGYFKRTEGKDGDHVDVFVRHDDHEHGLDSEIVFVVNQFVGGKFDEHKCVVGCNSERQARETYLRNYQDGWDGLHSIKAMTIDQFKDWLENGDTTKKAAKAFHPDLCPECDRPVRGRCRCMMGNRSCEAGHDWWVCYKHKKKFTGPGHGVETTESPRGRKPGEEPPCLCPKADTEKAAALTPAQWECETCKKRYDEPPAADKCPECSGDIQLYRTKAEHARRARESVCRKFDVFDGIQAYCKPESGNIKIFMDFMDWAESDACKLLQTRMEKAYGKENVEIVNEGPQPEGTGWFKVELPGVEIGKEVKTKTAADMCVTVIRLFKQLPKEFLEGPYGEEDEDEDKMPKDRPYTIAVDFDGTIAESTVPFDPEKVGKPIQKTINFMRECRLRGARLIIHTVRGNLDPVKDYLFEHDVPYDYINENPDQPEGSSDKLYADVYVDDRAENIEDINDDDEEARLAVYDAIEDHKTKRKR